MAVNLVSLSVLGMVVSHARVSLVLLIVVVLVVLLRLRRADAFVSVSRCFKSHTPFVNHPIGAIEACLLGSPGFSVGKPVFLAGLNSSVVKDRLPYRSSSTRNSRCSFDMSAPARVSEE